MHLAPWRPFQDMNEFFNRHSRLLKRGVASPFDDDGNELSSWMPATNVSETKKEYLIKAELPEVDKDDINISVKDGTLTIEGERKHESEEEDETYHRVESFYGRFSRVFALPPNVDESKIKADCKKGVLRVHLPKAKEAAPDVAKRIDIS